MKSGAKFSDCRKYRYSLWRIWDESKPYVMFIGLNPSTADETKNDPTLSRCIRYARAWNYGGVYMVNLFSFVATDPKVMLLDPEPIGYENDQWLLHHARNAGVVVCAWGENGGHLNRSTQIKKLIPNPHYLKLNQSGEPAHPLYLKKNMQPVPFRANTGDLDD